MLDCQTWPQGVAAIPGLIGNLKGLATAERRRLEKLQQRRVPTNRVVSPEFARELTELSAALRRRLGVLVDRAGRGPTRVAAVRPRCAGPDAALGSPRQSRAQEDEPVDGADEHGTTDDVADRDRHEVRRDEVGPGEIGELILGEAAGSDGSVFVLQH